MQGSYSGQKSYFQIPSQMEKRRSAMHTVRYVLDAAEDGIVPFGDWESGCVNAALRQMQSGFYEAAIANASRSLLPEAYRDPHRVANFRKQPTLKETRQAFEHLWDDRN